MSSLKEIVKVLFLIDFLIKFWGKRFLGGNFYEKTQNCFNLYFKSFFLDSSTRKALQLMRNTKYMIEIG